MAATKYLDYNGLLYFWTLIKNMFAKPSDANPQMDGTASAGSSALYARGDHVHPSDSSKADAATTLAGYGITDAKIASGTITLGSNTITPLTASSALDASKLTGTASVDTTGNAATADVADKVANKLILKVKTGTTEGTDLYTYDGSGAKTFDIKQGSNVTLTAAAGSVTIAATNTKNTAGSTDSSSKLFLIGATSQAASPQTYSQDTAYVGTDGHLYSNSKKVFTADDAYTKSEIDTKLTGGMHYKGSVQTTADLPASGNEVGDFYNVIATGENYAWDGTAWDQTGSMVDLQPITNAEIDTIVAS